MAALSGQSRQVRASLTLCVTERAMTVARNLNVGINALSESAHSAHVAHEGISSSQRVVNYGAVHVRSVHETLGRILSSKTNNESEESKFSQFRMSTEL